MLDSATTSSTLVLPAHAAHEDVIMSSSTASCVHKDANVKYPVSSLWDEYLTEHTVSHQDYFAVFNGARGISLHVSHSPCR